jgi:AraC-like DNA-binding protein
MRDKYYEFVDLDSDKSFQLLGKSFNGILQNKTLYFNNTIAKGQIEKVTPEQGLCVRKWKLTVLQKVTLHKLSSPATGEKKFSLIYFLNPSVFKLKNKSKKINVTGHCNNLFLSNEVKMDFSVIPKQPFYVLDITFTASWLSNQFNNADADFKKFLDQYLTRYTKTILKEPCTSEEYKALHELDVVMQHNKEDILFIRSRIYELVFSFFDKVFNKKETERVSGVVNYDQIVQAETIIMENLKTLPKTDTIAKKVNMSVSSLLRQFKIMYGRSIYEYYLEKKMELAKKTLLEQEVTVKKIAEMFGYNQASPFIEAFAKLHGYNPGYLKAYK